MRKEKKFYVTGREDEVLLSGWNGAGGCITTDRITVDGLPVGYMYREKTREGSPFEGYDSGWRFTAGDESDKYMMMLYRQTEIKALYYKEMWYDSRLATKYYSL